MVEEVGVQSQIFEMGWRGWVSLKHLSRINSKRGWAKVKIVCMGKEDLEGVTIPPS